MACRERNPVMTQASPGGPKSPVTTGRIFGRCEKESVRAAGRLGQRKVLSRGRIFGRPAKGIRPGCWPARPAAKCHDRIFIWAKNPSDGFFVPTRELCPSPPPHLFILQHEILLFYVADLQNRSASFALQIRLKIRISASDLADLADLHSSEFCRSAYPPRIWRICTMACCRSAISASGEADLLCRSASDLADL